MNTGDKGEHRVQATPLSRGDGKVAWGLFLVLVCIYGLTASGRIDTIDGQYRFEVTRSILDGYGFEVRDPKLLSSVGVEGRRYADYGPLASVFALPLCFLGRLLVGRGINSDMFFFSLTSGVVASFAVALFYRMQRRMGASPRQGIFWSLALALTTPLWPLAVSVFHQPQQAALTLLGVYLAWESALRRRPLLGLLSGVAGGSLGLFNLGSFILVPPIGLAVFENLQVRGRAPRAVLTEMFRRYFPFGVGVLVPFCLALLFNYVRYGHPLTEGSASQPNHPPIWGNPLVGLCGLLFSPGKSLFLFFPTIGLLFLYLPRCFRRFPGLTIALVSVCLLSLGLAASFSMWASDWAWGPRYLMVLAPIASLPFGMRSEGSAERKSVVIALLTLGLGSQVLGISVEHLRFFLEQQVDGYFWYSDPTFYYRESQFFARFAEFYSVIFEGPPASAQVFSGMVASGGPPTYTVTRAVPEIAHIMMRNHSVFYLPRPWPFWIPTLPLEIQPINPLGMMAFMASLGGLGIWLARSGLRGQPSRAATGDSVRRV